MVDYQYKRWDALNPYSLTPCHPLGLRARGGTPPPSKPEPARAERMHASDWYQRGITVRKAVDQIAETVTVDAKLRRSIRDRFCEGLQDELEGERALAAFVGGFHHTDFDRMMIDYFGGAS